jgi:hypothetical protein
MFFITFNWFPLISTQIRMKWYGGHQNLYLHLSHKKKSSGHQIISNATPCVSNKLAATKLPITRLCVDNNLVATKLLQGQYLKA